MTEWKPMQTKEPWFPKFKPYQGDLDNAPVQVDKYLPAGKSIILGLQHAFAMFGATLLAPLLMSFDPNLTIFITGIGTILFFLMTGGRMPSYLGSNFDFIGAVTAATGYAGVGSNANIGLALAGTIIYAAIGLIVMKTEMGWIEKLMPPIVTGAIVMIIGLYSPSEFIERDNLKWDKLWNEFCNSDMLKIYRLYVIIC